MKKWKSGLKLSQQVDGYGHLRGNPRFGRAIFANKLTELEALNRVTPWLKLEVATTALPPNGGEWFPRTMKHYKCRDFTRRVRVPGYWTKRVLRAKEYRVHLVRGQIVSAYFKRPFAGHEDDKFLYNGTSKWVLQRTKKWMQKLIPVAEQLGIDYGAFDVLRGTDGELRILEVNFKPGLSDINARRYLDAIQSPGVGNGHHATNSRRGAEVAT